MGHAKQGDTVRIHYTGTLDDGSVFDSSDGREPLEFILGSQMVIPGFENAVMGMEVGQSQTVRIESEDAYGDYDEDLLFEIDRSDFPDDLEPEVGMALQVSSESGEVSSVMIHDIGDDFITLDGNHPLAGEALTFEIKLVEIVP